MRFFFALIILTSIGLPTPGFAADDRQKNIEFDDGTVEGVNRRSRDSFSQVGDKDRNNKKPHLYWKRADFKEETNQALKDLEYQPQ